MLHGEADTDLRGKWVQNVKIHKQHRIILITKRSEYKGKTVKLP
jgi:hypothetical protein